MDIGKELQSLLPADRIKTRYIDRVTYGSDAGFYYLLPKAVVLPISETEIIALFGFSQRYRIPLVFRAGGTSLSGQSVTDGILVDLSRHWRRVEPLAEGRIVRFGPGVTGVIVNARLKMFHRKIGPDPSSIAAAMMGGILSNNASGMCCGVANNAYHTLKHIRFILPGGAIFDTADAADYDRFLHECPGIAHELESLRGDIVSDAGLRDKIRYKYRTKNTVGYSLNAFLDYEHPLDILAHLLIGAEGTLAFIAEASLETVPQLPCKSTGLLYFPDLHAACNAIPSLIEAGAEAVELMDRASLRAVEAIPGMPPLLKTLPPKAAALLVEFQGEEEEEAGRKLALFLEAAQALSILYPPAFTRDAAAQELLWKVRKGLFPSVGAVRKSGTTVILEDIAFPVDRLGDAVTDLQTLFTEFGYDNAIIFGHAKDGNIHFVITQSFGTATEVDRYARFIDRLVPLVVGKYGGALKAEHGTGRNMAPFVETEWGPAAYQVMQRLKTAIDPLDLLNPGVIISSDDCVNRKFGHLIESAYLSAVMLLSDIRRLAAERLPGTIADRRHLHAYPELSFSEIETSAFIKARLDELGIQRTGMAGTGVVAAIEGRTVSGRMVALRADMDALPITELNTPDYVSKHPGVMHACGHDAHTASLLATAAILQSLRDRWSGTVRLIFQPAEEKLPGGASGMIREGVLQNPAPIAVIGQHVMPSVPVGKIAIRSGQLMASMDEINATIHGKGGHGAMPQLLVDPVLISAHLIVALQQIVSRNNNPITPGVLSFGRVIADGAINVIPDTVQLQGTFRTVDENWRYAAHEKMKRMAEQIAAAMGGTCEFNVICGYPSLMNDPRLTGELERAAVAYLGIENVIPTDPMMIAEDFAYYGRSAPACFYFLGTGNAAKGTVAPLHNPRFDIDEEALEVSSGLMAYMALQQLGNS